MNKKYDRIISKSIRLFLDNDVKKTTMDEIAEEANVSKVTVYKYFGDKENLYKKVCEEIYADYIRSLKENNESNADIKEKLYAAVGIMTEFIACKKALVCEELAKYYDETEEESTARVSRYEDALTTLIEEGKHENIIRKDIDTVYIFYYIDMGIAYYKNSVIYRNKMDRDAGFQEKFVDFYIKNIFIDSDVTI